VPKRSAGSPTDGENTVALDTTGARRQVTVLFCDLVGSTALSGEVDPEEFHDLLGRYQLEAVAAIESFGGRLHHTLGDGLIASWGYPRAHEDDATRAVFAGLGVLEAIRRLGAASDAPALAVRIGIHTGLAVIADTAVGQLREEANLIGEAPNIAARLQSISEPGSLVISETTEDLVRDRFELMALGTPPLKGVNRPVMVFTVIRPVENDRLALPQATEGKIVGRAAELQAIDAAWDATCGQDGVVLVLRGAPGLGKTELAHHACMLAEASRGHHVTVQCASLQTNNAFYAVRHALERAAAITPGDGMDERREHLLTFCSLNPSLRDDEALGVLAALLGIPPGDGVPALALAPEQRRERTFTVLLDFIDSLSTASPCLLVVEDVHWSDPSTLELLRRLLARGPAPQMLVLVTMRPPANEFPVTGAKVLDLAPLGAEDIRQLAGQVSPGLPNDLKEVVVQRADGVPLFAVELARMLARTGRTAPADLPPRLHDLLVARLDQRPDERPLAQIVATVGVSAPWSLIERLAGLPPADVRRALGVLVEAGILRDEGPAHDPMYRFPHVLLRDAAYTTLLRSSRRSLHGAVAAQLQADAEAESGLVAPHLVAYHLEQAGQVPASLLWWQEAARVAAEVAAHREVVVHLRHLLELLQVTGPVPGVDEIELLALLGASLAAIEGYTSEEVARIHERARLLLTEREDESPSPGSFYAIWAYHFVRGQRQLSSALSQELWARFAKVDGQQRSLAAAMAGYERFEDGDLAAAGSLLETARDGPVDPIPEIPHDLYSAATVLLGAVRWIAGDRVAGRAGVEEAVQRVDGLGFPKGPFSRAFVHSYAAWWSLLADDPVAAARHAQQSIAEAAANGYATWLAASSMHAAGAQARLGDPAAARRTLEQLVAMWRTAGAETFRSAFLRWLAEAHAGCGDHRAALAVVDEGIDHAQRFLGSVHEPELHRARGLLLRHLGDHQGALASLRRAARLAGKQGARSFALRALTDLVDLSGTDASPADRSELAAVVRQFPPSLADADLVRARRLLEAS
jgi:class 3 adenylate cyclase/tetratricopeptide (TPR) repeat protein